MNGERAVVIYSGGMDSTVLLYLLRSEGVEVKALGIDYGQRHRIELSYAAAIAGALNVPFEVADLSGVTRLLAGSSQTSPEIPVPEGHYAAENMKLTVVPNRNMIMLAVAIGHAISIGYPVVAYGAHAGDHAIYPDCRPEFAAAMEAVAGLCDYQPIRLVRPFMHADKATICKIGDQLGVPFFATWSCYKGGVKHCGKCGTCVERREAFQLAGVVDPTLYECE